MPPLEMPGRNALGTILSGPPAKPERPVPIRAAAMVAIFRAAADTARARILLMLGDGQRTLDEIAAEVGLSPTAFYNHLRLLWSAGLVDLRQDGRRHFCELTDAGRAMASAVATLGG
jgi:DNA-binding transcriptional ArsR family regulator